MYKLILYYHSLHGQTVLLLFVPKYIFFFFSTEVLVKWTSWISTPVAPFQKYCAYKLILKKLDLFSAHYSYLVQGCQ